MALIDDKTLKTLGTNWELLLTGEGIVTNMSGPNENLLFRYDSTIPGANDASRVIYGRSDYNNKDSFVNQSEDSKIYGRAATGSVEVFVTRNV